jgi:hypothetical protein
MRRRSLWLAALAALLITGLGGGLWAFAHATHGVAAGHGAMGGAPVWIEGDGPVTTLEQARAAAQRYASPLDLRVGEVMQFSENFYAELVTASGDKATEVLIDPATGQVRIEYGPAMMWNTVYGMYATTSGTRSSGVGGSRMGGPGMGDPNATGAVQVSEDQAVEIADQWLAAHQPGRGATQPDEFPGYYTLHIVENGAITGMLSVNATTGEVWYHSWHGDFVAMSES